MKNKVVTQGDLLGGGVLDQVRALLDVQVGQEAIASWEQPAFSGVAAVVPKGSITKVEYLLPGKAWTTWTATVEVPLKTGVRIRCTARNDTAVKIGIAIDFYMADPDDWALGKWTITDPGPYVGVEAGKELISEDYIFTITKAGLHDVLFVVRGQA